MRLDRLKTRLRERAQDPRGNLRLLLSGAFLFFTGLGSIMLAQHALPAGLKAEFLALAGLILLGLGSILALFGYLSLSLLRIWHFLDDDDEQRNPPPRH
ncbi:MAG: hypothetical protein GYB41_06535 [Oceanospirillales bacterium]|uniref:DUF485 domain-containing protein n=1 Tax=Marinobacterium halophilum TaxID=267374 RepID=A0A2P8ESS7_9GAMM|nr:hypothetical protein [Marinobacterium halophilum]MBR9828282.1 hypothetical protein [Oceanospirillales bacterium]PSL12488.1 hypothetical protein CLV44_11717 [Marinobacterium halophilum]